ncbi:MAG: hypothetical protein WCZ89_08740, partial [Phycisphaerae bacterium]
MAKLSRLVVPGYPRHITQGCNRRSQIFFVIAFSYYHSGHLGSSEIMTDRDGNLVQHYPDVSGFDNERYKEDNSAFSVSNRYTGQILDEDTGLY